MKYKMSKLVTGLGCMLMAGWLMVTPAAAKDSSAKTDAAHMSVIQEADWDHMAVADVSTYVNIRKEASVSSKVVGVLADGHAVTVTGKSGDWTCIRSGKIKGYIKTSYLLFKNKAKKHYLETTGVIAEVTADKTKLREKASGKSDALDTIKKDERLRITGQYGDWYAVDCGEKTAYVVCKKVELEPLAGAESYEDYKKEESLYAGNTAVHCSDRQLDELAAIIECEAGGESYTGMVAVGACVINRVKSSSFPDTITEVIHQSGQFSPVSSGKFDRILGRGAREDCYKAAKAALAGENPIGSCLYFSAGRGRGVQIGNQHFY